MGTDRQSSRRKKVSMTQAKREREKWQIARGTDNRRERVDGVVTK